MRKIILHFWIILLIAGLSSCADKETGFKITGNLTGCDNISIMVSENIPEMKSWFIDTIDVKEGKFTWEGKVNTPRMMVFTIMRNDDFYSSFGIFLDNSNVKINGDCNDMSNLKITGSKTHDEYVSIKENSRAVMTKYQELQAQRGQLLKENKPRDSQLEEEYKKAFEDMKNFYLGVSNYNSSEVMPYFIYENFNTSDPTLLKEVISGWDTALYNNPYVEYLIQDLKREEKASVGTQAFDFELPDSQGNVYKLSDYRGKHVLLEFSASWCGWCKKEIPYLERLYEETRREDLEMFTIYLDQKKADWINDLTKHPLSWKVLCDLQGFEGPVPPAYNVHGVPAIFLIGPDGKIISKGLRGDSMIETVKSIVFKSE